MEARYGGAEGLHKMMQEMGRLGGRASNTGGFAADPRAAVDAGAKGGRNSRRGRKYLGIKDGIMRWEVKETGEIESISVKEYAKECAAKRKEGEKWFQRSGRGGNC